MIHFSCKWCGKRYHAPARYAGRSEACKDCGKPVFVPKQSMASGPALQFACPRCGKRYRTSARYAGVKQACRGCGELIAAPERPATAPAAGNGPPVDSPFEIEPSTEAKKLAELEAFLDLPPFELVPTADDFPDAPLLDDDAPPEAGPPALAAKSPPVPVAPPLIPVAAAPPPVATMVPAPPPVATIVPAAPQALYVPPPPPVAAPPVVVSPPMFAPPTPTPPAPRVEDLPQAPLVESVSEPLPPPRPEPPPKPKGCPHCGAEGSYNLHSRSPLGILAMLFGTLGGLGALCLAEDDWRYGIAAGVAFAVAVGGAFLKRWTIICSGCERRLY